MRGQNKEDVMANNRALSIAQGVKTRFAPAPTGSLHVGGARTMLYNWLVSKQYNGQLLLRIEDTDQSRSSLADIDEIKRMLEWLQLDYQTELMQSEHSQLHQQALQRLIAQGQVYRDTATFEDVQKWKKEHGQDQGYRGAEQEEGSYRLRVDEQQVIRINDLIQGAKEFKGQHIDDPVIARSDGSPLYNLAVAVDDAEANIELVIRGEDHVSNIPKQVLILQALGKSIPNYAHLPLLHGPDGRKLSKSHKTPQGAPLAITVERLKERGYLPEAVLSYLAQLGWGQDEEQLLSKEELLEVFDLGNVSRNPAQFDEVKLKNFNGKWNRRIPKEDFAQRAAAFINRPLDTQLTYGLESIQERTRDFAEVEDYLAYSWQGIATDEKALKDQHKFLRAQAKPVLQNVKTRLSAVENWNPDAINQAMEGLAEQFTELKPVKIFQPLRVALTGKSISPPTTATIFMLSKKEALQRIDEAIAKIELKNT